MAHGHRYFFCIRPPSSAARRIGMLRDGLGCNGTVVANERLHVTLGITCDYPEHVQQVANQLLAVGGLIDVDAFRVSFDRLSGSGSTIALRPSKAQAGLNILHRQIGRAMAATGLLRAGWSCNPHITLAYRDGQPFLRSCPVFAWEAMELVLIHSLLGETKHVELARWPLVRRQLDLLAL